jgi:hypothetical protein
MILNGSIILIEIDFEDYEEMFEDYEEMFEDITEYHEPLILPNYIKKWHTSKIKECTICLESIKGESFKTKCKCKNLYHKECIKKWLEIKRNCPTCKNSLSIVK